MKKQYINLITTLSIIFIVGILVGKIIVPHFQESKVPIEITTESAESVLYLAQPKFVRHFLYEGEISANDGRFVEIVLYEEPIYDYEDNVVSEDVTGDEAEEVNCIINADHYACSVDEIYFTNPIREYTEEQRELLAKMLYCEARGSSWDGQVATCSAIINHIENNRGDFGVLDKQNHFDPAPYYRYETPNQMQYDVVDYVLSGHLIANVKYFRMSYYHNFGTPMFAIDGEYYSR